MLHGRLAFKAHTAAGGGKSRGICVSCGGLAMMVAGRWPDQWPLLAARKTTGKLEKVTSPDSTF